MDGSILKGGDKRMKNKEITKQSLKHIKDLLNNVKDMTEEDFRKILDSMTKFHEYSLFN